MKEIFVPPQQESRTRVLVRQQGVSESYEWLVLNADEVVATGQGDLDALAARVRAAVGAELILLLSPGDVSVREVPLTASERRHYRSLIPFALEEDLVEVTEELHFAYARIADDRVGVAIIQRARLEQLLQRFAAQGLSVDSVLPEVLLLPWDTAEQTWLLREDEVVVRTGPCRGFVVPLADVAIVAALADAEGEPPQAVTWVVQQGDDRLQGAPEPALEGCTFTHVSVAHRLSWQAQFLPEMTLELLQGEFRPALPWRRYWRQWRLVAYVVIAALAVNLGVHVYQYASVKQRSAQLKQEQYALVRAVFPRGRIQSPERQLRAEWRRMNVVGPTNLGSLLAQVGPKLAGKAGYSLRSIVYDGNAGSLRLEVRAESFQQIEQLRTVLEEQGLQAKLLNSSARTGGILARLEIKEAGA